MTPSTTSSSTILISTNEEVYDWEEFNDTEAAASSPQFRPFASPSRRASAPPPVTLPPLTDPRWQHGVYTASQAVAAFQQPDLRSDLIFFLPPHLQKPRPLLRYLPEVMPGWTAVHVSSSTGFVLSSAIRFEPYRWWREGLDGLLMLCLLVALIASWLVGKVEHQQTVDSLNATITTQQAIIVQQQATLEAITSAP